MSDAVGSELICQMPELSFFFPLSFSNAETVVTDVALVMGFILVLFCVADCCAERRILGVFLIFFFKSQQLFYQS